MYVAKDCVVHSFTHSCSVMDEPHSTLSPCGGATLVLQGSYELCQPGLLGSTLLNLLRVHYPTGSQQGDSDPPLKDYHYDYI